MLFPSQRDVFQKPAKASIICLKTREKKRGEIEETGTKQRGKAEINFI